MTKLVINFIVKLFKKANRLERIKFIWDGANLKNPEHLSLNKEPNKDGYNFDMHCFLAFQRKLIHTKDKSKHHKKKYRIEFFEELSKIANLYVWTHGVYPYWKEIMKVIDPTNRYFKPHRILSTNQSDSKSVETVFLEEIKQRYKNWVSEITPEFIKTKALEMSKHTIIIDDTKSAWEEPWSNLVVPIKKFYVRLNKINERNIEYFQYYPIRRNGFFDKTLNHIEFANPEKLHQQNQLDEVKHFIVNQVNKNLIMKHDNSEMSKSNNKLWSSAKLILSTSKFHVLKNKKFVTSFWHLPSTELRATLKFIINALGGSYKSINDLWTQNHEHSKWDLKGKIYLKWSY